MSASPELLPSALRHHTPHFTQLHSHDPAISHDEAALSSPGVEHLLRDVKDATLSSLAGDVAGRLLALKGLQVRAVAAAAGLWMHGWAGAL